MKDDAESTNHTGVKQAEHTGVHQYYSSEEVSPLYAILRLRRFPVGVRNNDLSIEYVLSPIVNKGCVPSAGVQRLYPRSDKQLLCLIMGYGQKMKPLAEAHLKNLTHITFCCANVW